MLVTALLSCALMLAGCSKDGSRDFPGSYTYKTSGTVTLMASALAGLDEATLAAYKAAGMNVDPVVVGLYPEQGQMHVIKDGDRFILTFNDILGNADIAYATADGDELDIAPGQTKAAQLTDGSEKIGAGMVAFSGSGKKYDDMLLLDLEYQGVFSVNDIPMTVVASDVHCVAQKN